MARRARGGRRDEIARAILEEFGAETAGEAQEALRQILGPTIEAMLRAELDCFLSIRSDQKYHQELNIPMICFCTSRSRDMASLRT